MLLIATCSDIFLHPTSAHFKRYLAQDLRKVVLKNHEKLDSIFTGDPKMEGKIVTNSIQAIKTLPLPLITLKPIL